MRLLNCNQPFTIIVIDLFILLKKNTFSYYEISPAKTSHELPTSAIIKII
jgi:hypothetical protein